jgi:hypothetical protein
MLYNIIEEWIAVAGCQNKQTFNHTIGACSKDEIKNEWRMQVGMMTTIKKINGYNLSFSNYWHQNMATINLAQRNGVTPLG